jgi:hypothetical protein
MPKRIDRQRHIDVGLHTAAFDDSAAPRVPPSGEEPNDKPMADNKIRAPSTCPPVRVPTILASPVLLRERCARIDILTSR